MAQKPKFPDNHRDLVTRGYTFDGKGECRSCHTELYWYTTPNGKKMPFSKKGTDIVGHDVQIILEPHFASCPNAGDFQRRR